MTSTMKWLTMMTLMTILLFLIGYSKAQLAREQALQLNQKVRKLPNDICGETYDDETDLRIIGGDESKLGAYSWMAAIGYRLKDKGPLWLCGGSLITNQYVLTAAHCLHSKKIKPYKLDLVRLGDLDLNDTVVDGATPLDLEIEKIVIHKEYNSILKVNDIGLIKLKNKVHFDDTLKPICLSSPELYTKSFTGLTATVAGWGRTFTRNMPRAETSSTHLQEVVVQIQNLEECKRNLTSLRTRVVMDERVICQSAVDKGTCQGDSGGPLMLSRHYKGRDKMYILGIVSYGYGCARDGYPGVCTRVSRFMDWIITNLDI